MRQPVRRKSNFTLLNGLIAFGVLAVISLVVLLVFFNILFNRPGQTQERAERQAHVWVQEANLSVGRLTCAHDSDHDGFGSCTLVTQQGEKVYLQCVAGQFQVWTGAKGCKEVDTLVKIATTPRRR